MESEVEDFLMTSAVSVSDESTGRMSAGLATPLSCRAAGTLARRGQSQRGLCQTKRPQIIEGIDSGDRSIDRKPSQGEPDGR